MSNGLEATESYDGTITVHILADDEETERRTCSSYEQAIDLVKRHRDSATAVKIEDQDGEIVFTSAEMDIETWEVQWKHAKRQLSVDSDEYECPYDNVACFEDDRCVQCQMDKVQENY